MELHLYFAFTFILRYCIVLLTGASLFILRVRPVQVGLMRITSWERLMTQRQSSTQQNNSPQASSWPCELFSIPKSGVLAQLWPLTLDHVTLHIAIGYFPRQSERLSGLGDEGCAKLLSTAGTLHGKILLV